MGLAGMYGRRNPKIHPEHLWCWLSIWIQCQQCGAGLSPSAAYSHCVVNVLYDQPNTDCTLIEWSKNERGACSPFQNTAGLESKTDYTPECKNTWSITCKKNVIGCLVAGRIKPPIWKYSCRIKAASDHQNYIQLPCPCRFSLSIVKKLLLGFFTVFEAFSLKKF